jgi:hypothetical protein
VSIVSLMSIDGLFTQEQQLSFLKDQAIFSDTLYQRKKAIMELVRNCEDIETLSDMLCEIINSCLQTGDTDFKEFCLALKFSIHERDKPIGKIYH